MPRRRVERWLSRGGVAVTVLAMASGAVIAHAQSMSFPAAVVRDSANQLVGEAIIGTAGFVSVVLEVDGTLAQFDVSRNGPESQLVSFDGNNCFGSPYLGEAFQNLAIMVGTQFGVAGGDPDAANPTMKVFNTYTSVAGTGAVQVIKSSWSMALGCVDFGGGMNQSVLAALPVTTNPFAGMSRPFNVHTPTQAIVVNDN